MTVSDSNVPKRPPGAKTVPPRTRVGSLGPRIPYPFGFMNIGAAHPTRHLAVEQFDPSTPPGHLVQQLVNNENSPACVPPYTPCDLTRIAPLDAYSQNPFHSPDSTYTGDGMSRAHSHYHVSVSSPSPSTPHEETGFKDNQAIASINTSLRNPHYNTKVWRNAPKILDLADQNSLENMPRLVVRLKNKNSSDAPPTSSQSTSTSSSRQYPFRIPGEPAPRDPPTTSSNSDPSTYGQYIIPKKLIGIRKALGEADWSRYVANVEARLAGNIDEAELERRERSMFMTYGPKMRGQIRKHMVDMVQMKNRAS